MIDEILAKRDAFEILGDEIAAILVIESAPQAALRVFRERSAPWEQFLETDDAAAAPPTNAPIVNVTWSGGTFDEKSGNVVSRQRSSSTYWLDVYAAAVSADNPLGGHVPGDEEAARRMQMGVRVVRNILMAAKYTYLGHRGTVARRWISNIETFHPAIDAQTVQRVIAARMTFQVDHNEFSPQFAGEPLELISISVRRRETGELYFNAAVDTTSEET